MNVLGLSMIGAVSGLAVAVIAFRSTVWIRCAIAVGIIGLAEQALRSGDPEWMGPMGALIITGQVTFLAKYFRSIRTTARDQTRDDKDSNK